MLAVYFIGKSSIKIASDISV